MDNIIEPTMDYDFSKLYLGQPSTLAGGSYFTRIMYNSNQLLHLQTPKCLTKQGFVKSGKKLFIDLMFDNNDTIFINWIENLESKCQELIHNKGDAWFQTKLEKDDIETAFTSPFKIYKSGKYYCLRVNVKPNIKIYNEADETIKIEDITSTNYIISIIEIQGIKFTSRNFQIEIELKQSMIVSPDPFLDECFIKKPLKKQSVINTNIASFEKISNNNRKIDLDDFIKDTVDELTSATTFHKVEPKITSIMTPINLDIDSSLPKGEDVDEKEKEEEDEEDEAEEEEEEEDVVDYKTPNNILDLNKNNENDNHLFLEIEDLNFTEKEDPNILKEVDLDSSLVNSLETITLKKPNQVHYENYKQAKDKAKKAKQLAIAAYLEAKNIKNTYLLDDSDDSDESDESDDGDFDFDAQ